MGPVSNASGYEWLPCSNISNYRHFDSLCHTLCRCDVCLMPQIGICHDHDMHMVYRDRLNMYWQTTNIQMIDLDLLQIRMNFMILNDYARLKSKFCTCLVSRSRIEEIIFHSKAHSKFNVSGNFLPNWSEHFLFPKCTGLLDSWNLELISIRIPYINLLSSGAGTISFSAVFAPVWTIGHYAGKYCFTFIVLDLYNLQCYSVDKNFDWGGGHKTYWKVLDLTILH